MGKLTPTVLLAGSVLAQTLAGQPPPAPISVPLNQQNLGANRYRLENADQLVRDTLAKLAILSRSTDPFGLSQDPDAQPQKPKIVPKNNSKYQNIAPTPFADVIAAIRVNGVMPGQGRFLVRSRTFKAGDTFPLRYLDKSIQVQVLHVSASAIDFKNLQTGESASLALNLLPSGMQRGGTGNNGPPGLERDNPSAPLEVDVAPPPTAATERR